MQISRLWLFSGDKCSPQTQSELGQSEQPSGQLRLHGQSEKSLRLSFFYRKVFLYLQPFIQSVSALPQSIKQFVSPHDKVQST